MTHRLSYPVGSHDHGFTLRPLSSTVTGRSLSMQDRAHFPDAKSCDLMRLCGNIAPMQYEAHAMGYELAHDEKAERVRQLKSELAALAAAA